MDYLRFEMMAVHHYHDTIRLVLFFGESRDTTQEHKDGELLMSIYLKTRAD